LDGDRQDGGAVFQARPLGAALDPMGGITRMGSRMVEAWGDIRLSDGSLAAKSKGVYVEAAPEMVKALKGEAKYWRVVPS